MKTKTTLWTVFAVAFLAGTALPLLVVWNPARWQWADRLVERVHRPHAAVEVPAVEQLWTCGMHPQVVQDEPGNCPICGMNLVPLGGLATSPPAEPGQGERKIKHWRAPMDPNYISDRPGKSPMGMDLIPVYEDEEGAGGGIRVDPSFLQNFSVRTAVVDRGSVPVKTRTIGILAYNEKNIVSVNTKFEGWIEKAHVNYIGEPVRRGQALLEIYSPQLVTTQREYLSTLAYLEKLSDSSNTEAFDRAQSLLEATRERLRYWDISDAQIDKLRESGRITRTLKILAPVSGVVAEKMSDSLEGMKLSPGMNVFKIADLSTVWADIEVFEYQIQFLRLGQSAQIAIDAFPGRKWSGRIVYIDPNLNEKTRTLKASVEIANHGGMLRPNMFANVELRVPAVAGTVRVPEEAVLQSGDRSVVIVQKSKGVFEPREVQPGIAGGGYREIRSGLVPGEIVVTSSQFLIDSESNLKEAIRKMLSDAAIVEPGGSMTEAPHKH